MDEPVRLRREEIFARRPVRNTELEGKVPFTHLWRCGSLEGLARPCVAIVGTRGATAHGKATARRFAGDLVRAGCCIVSGLALGIDAAAHGGALEAGGATIGVLGGGHGRFFPRRNRELAQRMLEGGGAVLSPFAPEEEAHPWQFLARNAVVAALSDAVVVIEAPERSGALNTARHACGFIPVFAVPGDVDRPHVAGCHALIRDGATLARDARDVLEDLRIPYAGAFAGGAVEPEDEVQRAIVNALREGESALDDLTAACGAPTERMLATLALLELRGAVETRPGQRYALR